MSTPTIRIQLKRRRETEDALVAENCVLRAEVSKCRAKVEAMGDEFHAVKRKLLEETKRRQVGLFGKYVPKWQTAIGPQL